MPGGQRVLRAPVSPPTIRGCQHLPGSLHKAVIKSITGLKAMPLLWNDVSGVIHHYCLPWNRWDHIRNYFTKKKDSLIQLQRERRCHRLETWGRESIFKLLSPWAQQPRLCEGPVQSAVRSRDPTAGGGAAKQTQGWLEPAQHSSPEGGCSMKFNTTTTSRTDFAHECWTCGSNIQPITKENGTSTAVQLSSFLLPARARLCFENFQNLKKKWHIWLCLLK